MRSLILAWLLFLSLTASAAESAMWLDVPFVREPREGCGAASIAMILEYWRAQGYRAEAPAIDVGDIQRALYSPEDHGIKASVVRDYFEQHGFKTYVFHGDRELLAHHVARGRPLMVSLRPSAGALFHYLVVAGIEPQQDVILVNDPAERKLIKVGWRDFERKWQATGNWTLLVLPGRDSR